MFSSMRDERSASWTLSAFYFPSTDYCNYFYLPILLLVMNDIFITEFGTLFDHPNIKICEAQNACQSQRAFV